MRIPGARLAAGLSKMQQLRILSSYPAHEKHAGALMDTSRVEERKLDAESGIQDKQFRRGVAVCGSFRILRRLGRDRLNAQGRYRQQGEHRDKRQAVCRRTVV